MMKAMLDRTDVENSKEEYLPGNERPNVRSKERMSSENRIFEPRIGRLYPPDKRYSVRTRSERGIKVMLRTVTLRRSHTTRL